MKAQKIINAINQAFSSFWNNYENITAYYKEQDLNFSDQKIKQANHIVLVYPNLSSSYRTSLGEAYNNRSELIFNLRLYTSDKLGNIPHQSVLTKLLDFYKLSGRDYYLRGDARITGPFKTEDIKNFIQSNIAGTYVFNESVDFEESFLKLSDGSFLRLYNGGRLKIG